MRILLAAAEAYPFAKVGGLADVAGSLSQALSQRGHDVRLVLPAYPCAGRGTRFGSVQVAMGADVLRVDVERRRCQGGVELFTLASGRAFDRDRIYGYEDDDARFILFSKAVTAFAAANGWRPDVIHANDWHTALIAQHVRRGPERRALARSATVLTIHNLQYQGRIAPERARLIGIGHQEDAGLLSLGITWADAINTVSRRYRDEILTTEGGMRLDGLLRARQDRLIGILNGVDYQAFDPANDPHIAQRFTSTALHERAANKAALQRRSGLAVTEAPLVASVARLVGQKGIDLVCDAIEPIVSLGVQVLVMGAGERRYREALRAAAARHPGLVAYDEDCADERTRLVYAGCDLFLAPSTFEPCGLSPLIALRYGAIPVVRHTGGLVDTIVDYTADRRSGLGFAFRPRSSLSLVNTVRRGLAVHGDHVAWQALQRRAMDVRFSWESSVLEYERLYEQAMAHAAGLAKPLAAVRAAEVYA